MPNNELQPLPETRIVRARLDTLNVYEISENELESLERGGPESLLLNFSIFFLSNAISLTVPLLMSSVDIKSTRVFIVLVIVCVISWIAAAVLGALWLNGYRSKKSVIRIIKKRLPPEGTQIGL
jgi:Na+/proline symporter